MAGAQEGPLDLTQQPLRFLNAYWTLWQVLSERINAELVRQHDLDLRSFIALSYLQGGLTSPSDLSRQMVIPKYEVTRTLSRLSRLSAIDRRSDPSNARRQHLSVTAAGQGLWASALTTVQAVTQPPLDTLGPPLHDLTLHLEQLAAAAQVHQTNVTTRRTDDS